MGLVLRLYVKAIIMLNITFWLDIFVLPPMVHSSNPFVWVSGLIIFFGWIALCVWYSFIQVGKLLKCVKLS